MQVSNARIKGLHCYVDVYTIRPGRQRAHRRRAYATYADDVDAETYSLDLTTTADNADFDAVSTLLMSQYSQHYIRRIGKRSFEYNQPVHRVCKDKDCLQKISEGVVISV